MEAKKEKSIVKVDDIKQEDKMKEESAQVPVEKSNDVIRKEPSKQDSVKSSKDTLVGQKRDSVSSSMKNHYLENLNESHDRTQNSQEIKASESRASQKGLIEYMKQEYGMEGIDKNLKKVKQGKTKIILKKDMVSNTDSKTVNIHFLEQDSQQVKKKLKEEEEENFMSNSVSYEVPSCCYLVDNAFKDEKMEFEQKNKEIYENTLIDLKNQKMENENNLKCSLSVQIKTKPLLVHKYDEEFIKKYVNKNLESKEKFILNNCFIFRRMKNSRFDKSLYYFIKNKHKFFSTISRNNLLSDIEEVSPILLI
jgi:hypothetical protein